MDLSSPKTQPSLFPDQSACPPVTDEAFNLFHSIDRELYARLVRNLGRDPAESMHVMALWMWLEREGNDASLIRRMLSLPLPLLNELADEALTCLKCVEDDNYLFANASDQITLLPDLLSARVSLRFLHENRIAVLHGVAKMVTTVCSRAFDDIVQRLSLENNLMGMSGRPHLRFYPPSSSLQLDGVDRPPMLPSGGYGHLLSRNLLVETNGDLEELLPEDRTIFLTFSKGYPITEAEVREFFTRRFGDFIEDIIMQEVGKDEQVLYARMVARSAAVIHMIVGGNKSKYSINGKHVWARKYVKRLQAASSSSSVRSPPRDVDLSPSGQAGQVTTFS